MTRSSDMEMERRMRHALNSWAAEGTLPADKAYQLERSVFADSYPKRRGSVAYVLRGLVAALAACITMLFFACPAAGSVCSAVQILAESFPSPAAQIEHVSNNPAIGGLITTINNLDMKGILLQVRSSPHTRFPSPF